MFIQQICKGTRLLFPCSFFAISLLFRFLLVLCSFFMCLTAVLTEIKETKESRLSNRKRLQETHLKVPWKASRKFHKGVYYASEFPVFFPCTFRCVFLIACSVSWVILGRFFLLFPIISVRTVVIVVCFICPNCLSLRDNAACCIPLRDLRYLRENNTQEDSINIAQTNPSVSRRSRRFTQTKPKTAQLF